MTVLVTGSSGHLGEALVRTLQAQRRDVIGVDIRPGTFTHRVGSIIDRGFVSRCMNGIGTVLHTAALHKPHVATHGRQDFVDVNITGTLNLLEEAASENVVAFVYTSTTSVLGDTLVPRRGEPTVWVTEDVIPVPKNIYGVTKAAAEDLCQLFARNHSLRTIVLRTSRFFPEQDDNPNVREAYADANAKTNEFLYRRVDIEDQRGSDQLIAPLADGLPVLVPAPLVSVLQDLCRVWHRLPPKRACRCWSCGAGQSRGGPEAADDADCLRSCAHADRQAGRQGERLPAAGRQAAEVTVDGSRAGRHDRDP